jgi:hypothetical protein
MEHGLEVGAHLRYGSVRRIFDEELGVVVLQKEQQIAGVTPEDVNAIDQRLRAEVRPFFVVPLAEDDERSVGRVLYSLAR